MAANLKIEPTKIRELVEDYRSGRLVIPEFQRDYVLNKKKAPLLLDSLYEASLSPPCSPGRAPNTPPRVAEILDPVRGGICGG
jgi:uncharacterized protein with ParB-like and HNH nuclease domain